MEQPSWIPVSWNLPAEFRQRLGSMVGRQRLMQAGDEMLIVGHHPPEHDEVTRRGILFWLDATGEWHASNGEPGEQALGQHLDRYAQKLDEFDLMEEKACDADSYLRLLEGLVPLVRASRNWLEVLEQARQARPNERSLIDHRDKAYEISRHAELLYEDTKNSMDVAVVRRAEEQSLASRSMALAAHRLNILAALFFPSATLAAILGTTLTDNWSWSKSTFPFVFFILAATITGVVLCNYISRGYGTKKDWPR
jgi:hypothetical protein